MKIIDFICTVQNEAAVNETLATVSRLSFPLVKWGQESLASETSSSYCIKHRVYLVGDNRYHVCCITSVVHSYLQGKFEDLVVCLLNSHIITNPPKFLMYSVAIPPHQTAQLKSEKNLQFPRGTIFWLYGVLYLKASLLQYIVNYEQC